MIASAYSQQGLAADLARSVCLAYQAAIVLWLKGIQPAAGDDHADHAKGNYPDNAVFTGNVDINRGTADRRPMKCSFISSRPRAAAGAHGRRPRQRSL